MCEDLEGDGTGAGSCWVSVHVLVLFKCDRLRCIDYWQGQKEGSYRI